MSSNRILYGVMGLGVVGGGYYFYNAGGDPKVASKMAEHDAAKASAKIKSELPGSGKEAKKEGEVWADKAGKKLDDTVADAKGKGKEYDQKLGAKAEDLRKESKKAIDDFDRTVEKKTSEAKSGISGWFGGK